MGAKREKKKRQGNANEWCSKHVIIKVEMKWKYEEGY
jgi:hypothetical protein